MKPIKVERVDPRFGGGPKLWKLSLLWDVDEEIDAYGETLSQALSKLARRVNQLELSEYRETTGPGRPKVDRDRAPLWGKYGY